LEKIINKIGSILSKASTNKKLYVFLSCLGLTIFFWILNALGNNYTTTIAFEVSYINNPKSHVIINDLPEQLSLKVSGLGFDLLSYKLKIKSKPIIIDLSKVNIDESYGVLKKSNISFEDYKSLLFSQLGNQIEVIDIFPKSVDILLDEKATKLLEIIPVIDLQFEKQYQLDGDIRVKPAIVNVTGPKSIIDTLSKVYTHSIEYENLEESITHLASFNEVYKKQRINFELDQVIVFIPIEKFTESSSIIPLEYKNVPDSIEIKAIPDEVEIKYMVPLSKLSKITPTKFHAYVDYENVNKKYNKLKIVLQSYPDYLKSVTIKPSKVEYIVKKK